MGKKQLETKMNAKKNARFTRHTRTTVHVEENERRQIIKGQIGTMCNVMSQNVIYAMELTIYL